MEAAKELTKPAEEGLPDSGLTPYTSVLSRELPPHTSALSEEVTSHTSVLSGGLTPYVSPLYKGLDAIPKGFPSLPDDLKDDIAHLGKRCSKDKIKNIISTHRSSVCQYPAAN